MRSGSYARKIFFKTFQALTALISVCAVALLPFVAAAQDVNLEAAQSIGLSTVSLPVLVGRIIYAFLGLLGTVAAVLILYAGFIWMTSQGNDEKIKKAKSIITNAVIGLAIIMSAWAITAWIINALTEATFGSGGGQSERDKWYDLTSGPRTSELGNGLIEYVYPEPEQRDVPRNTKISITFKMPLGLSSVFKNYDDKGTYDRSDDLLCATAVPCETGTAITADTILELNTDNIRVIKIADMREAGTGSTDEQFDKRYPADLALGATAPRARVTEVTVDFTVPQSQTIVIKPVGLLGSPTGDVNYRVALRGGDNGIKVWEETDTPEAPTLVSAFTRRTTEGFYWNFTTGTLIDTTPPRIVALVPFTTQVPGVPDRSILDRNQLLQIYFDEAVDPTTASGILGTGGGFNLISISATCLPGTYPGSCDWNNGQPGVVPGKIVLGNRYRTAEFTPSQPCDGMFLENSCGEPVFCLPRNVELTVVAKAAEIDTVAPFDPEPPAAAKDNGVEDMVGNSVDGNDDGVAQGPQGEPEGSQPNGRPNAYDLNIAPGADATMSDTAKWRYHVGSNVDLTVPVLRVLDPLPPPPKSAEYPDGPSRIPTDLMPSLTWSKIMSVTSMRTGGFDEDAGDYPDRFSTVVLRSHELQKTSSAICTSPSDCSFVRIAPPGFFLGGQDSDEIPGTMLVKDATTGDLVTRISMIHPAPFKLANDLGFSEDEKNAVPNVIPAYVPVARAKLRDTKQNCFWPSRYATSDTSSECLLGSDQLSCCNQSGTEDGTFKTVCAPMP